VGTGSTPLAASARRIDASRRAKSDGRHYQGLNRWIRLPRYRPAACCGAEYLVRATAGPALRSADCRSPTRVDSPGRRLRVEWYFARPPEPGWYRFAAPKRTWVLAVTPACRSFGVSSSCNPYGTTIVSPGFRTRFWSMASPLISAL